MMLDLTDAINQLTQLDFTDLPAESPIRRRLAYIAIALAQEGQLWRRHKLLCAD